MNGFVYFLRVGDRVKIGWSSNPSRRIASLSTAMPDTPVVLGIHPGQKRDEAALHQRFKSSWVRGEWFFWSPDLQSVADAGFAQIEDEPAAVDDDFVESWPAPTHTLDQYLVEKSIPEARLARMVGCSQAQINRLRHGLSWPSRNMVIKLRDATDGAISGSSFMPDFHPAT